MYLREYITGYNVRGMRGDRRMNPLQDNNRHFAQPVHKLELQHVAKGVITVKTGFLYCPQCFMENKAVFSFDVRWLHTLNWYYSC